MRKLFSILFAFVAVVTLSSCRFVSPDADEEAVLVKKPWFFGHGGVDNDPVQSGLTWCAMSTHAETFKIVPVRHEVFLDDIFSDDNTPLDFHSVIVTQVEQGSSPVLLQNYGRDWFNTNLYNYFCNLVRDHISQYSPFDLMSNREVLSTIDKKILKQTQEREYEVQVAREKAERQKAVADKAYMSEMNLSPQQFIQLKWVETVAQKQGANIDVLVGPAEQMWNIKR